MTIRRDMLILLFSSVYLVPAGGPGFQRGIQPAKPFPHLGSRGTRSKPGPLDGLNFRTLSHLVVIRYDSPWILPGHIVYIQVPFDVDPSSK
jgi:hypothetical protein